MHKFLGWKPVSIFHASYISFTCQLNFYKGNLRHTVFLGWKTVKERLSGLVYFLHHLLWFISLLKLPPTQRSIIWFIVLACWSCYYVESSFQLCGWFLLKYLHYTMESWSVIVSIISISELSTCGYEGCGCNMRLKVAN